MSTYNTDNAIQTILTQLGTFIVANRHRKKLTQKEVNKKSHVSLAVIADLENCKSMPRIETLVRISSALEININEVFEVMKYNKSKNIDEPYKASILASFGYDKYEVELILQFMRFIKFEKNTH